MSGRVVFLALALSLALLSLPAGVTGGPSLSVTETAKAEHLCVIGSTENCLVEAYCRTDCPGSNLP